MQVNNNQPSFGMAIRKPNTKGWTGPQINALAKALADPDIIAIGKKADFDLEIAGKKFYKYERMGCHELREKEYSQNAIFATASKANKTLGEKIKHYFEAMPQIAGNSDSIEGVETEITLADRFKEAIKNAHKNYVEYIEEKDIPTAKSKLDAAITKANTPIKSTGGCHEEY